MFGDYPDPYDCVGGVSQVADAGVQEGALQAPRDRGQVSSSLHQGCGSGSVFSRIIGSDLL